ncbi:MAG: hypothetical protein ILP09_02525 [Oscillospiraceae bacterium]|nr:hypothetical protein [Oscillospiraceae bacterium]
MPEKIFTIPINEAFEKEGGCPFCALRERLEEQTLSYTLGSAMMEPDVRTAMNASGFCRAHLASLHSMKNKLSLGLILESHLDELIAALSPEPSGGKRGAFSRSRDDRPDAGDAIGRFSESCFICRRMADTEKRWFSNAVYLWSSDPAFREKLKRRSFFCLTHFSALLKAAKTELKASEYAELYTVMTGLEREYFSSLRSSVTQFNSSFDHRSSDKPLSPSARSALDDIRAVLR